jgi:hypothetical protein
MHRKRSPKQPHAKNIQGLEETKGDDDDDGVDTIRLNEILFMEKDED